MKIEINVGLSSADGFYRFDIFVDGEHHDGGVVEVDDYKDAIQWIGNNMLNNISRLNCKARRI
tara:strand:+ start:408 stop:596 length:189 start_codon:yes stop_codon:yes gene_type:complete